MNRTENTHVFSMRNQVANSTIYCCVEHTIKAFLEDKGTISVVHRETRTDSKQSSSYINLDLKDRSKLLMEIKKSLTMGMLCHLRRGDLKDKEDPALQYSNFRYSELSYDISFKEYLKGVWVGFCSWIGHRQSFYYIKRINKKYGHKHRRVF